MESTSIFKEYFDITKKYTELYGPRTILLMQVGGFFEIYGLKNKCGDIHGSHINELSKICQLNVVEKKLFYKSDQVLLAGIRDYVLERYIPRMLEANYVAVVFIQEKTDNGIIRKLDTIYSPGTFFNMDSSVHVSNNIMSIWIEKSKIKKQQKLIVGISVVNIITGESFIFEYVSDYNLNPTSFDELERFVSVYSPNEVILIHPFDEVTLQNVLQYTNLGEKMLHPIHDEQSNEYEKVKNCRKQVYIFNILESFFGENVSSNCTEFAEYAVATQSYCYLLNFIQEHNASMVRNIKIPSFHNTSYRVVLANHTLKQLNILDDHQSHGPYSSVMKFTNKCCYFGGKRMFQHLLTNPTYDESWLQTEYDAIESTIQHISTVNIDICRAELKKLVDMEKCARQIVMRKMTPLQANQFYKTLLSVLFIMNLFNDCPFIHDYLFAERPAIQGDCSKIIQTFERQLNMTAIEESNQSNVFESHIIQPGICKTLDDLLKTQKENEEIFQQIYDYLNNLMRQTPRDANTEFIKKHETEKNGMSLILTKRRAATLKTILDRKKKEVTQFGGATVCLGTIEIHSSSTSNDEIRFEVLNKIIKNRNQLQENIVAQTTNVFMQFVAEWEQYLPLIQHISSTLSKLDVLITKSMLAIKYNYCKPTLARTDNNQSFVNCKGIRHCLIEHLQTKELYVTNDVHLGCDDQNGILLYGTNAVGKTSLIRSIGVAVILAQCGMYVPCSQFDYKPYSAIYSRIIGNDNLFKGLSTFAVEISELRVILNYANENSLILGDEVCSGTETESALSIFTSALMSIHKAASSFIFATHFHEITHYDEIKCMERLKLYHMHVVFDAEQDKLIYDRKLHSGSGARNYGLEVCKSLYLDREFLETAYNIRNKYFPENAGILSLKPSVYNSKKLRGKCEMCHIELADETHHIFPQRDASETGYIDSFHKNHPANLMGLCEKCHKSVHNHK